MNSNVHLRMAKSSAFVTSEAIQTRVLSVSTFLNQLILLQWKAPDLLPESIFIFIFTERGMSEMEFS